MSIALYALCLILGLATNQLLFWFLGSPLGFEFLLGVAVARTPPRQLAGLAMIALALIWLMLSPAAFFGQAFGYGAVLRVFAWGMPAAMLLYGARSLEEWFVGGIFDMPVLIGSASYSIYLFHQLVLKVASGFVGFVASVMAGIVMYLVLERHIMRARLGLWVRRIRHWQGPAGTPVLDPQAKA